jgi:hypothetical protein
MDQFIRPPEEHYEHACPNCAFARGRIDCHERLAAVETS